MTEQEILVKMARRLENEGKAREVEYPTDDGCRMLEFESDYSYAVRFVFDDSGTVIECGGVV